MLGECRETAIECRHRELIYIYIYMCVCVFEINAFSIITPFPLYYFEWGAIILIVKSGPLRLPSACQSNPAHRCRDACRPEDRLAIHSGSLERGSVELGSLNAWACACVCVLPLLKKARDIGFNLSEVNQL